MKKFNISFLDRWFTTPPDVKFFQPYFLQYSPEKWVSEQAGGLLQYFDSKGNRYACMIVHSPEHGICIMLNKKKNREHSYTLVTVGNRDLMNEIIDVRSDERFPVGSFVKPADAWPIIEQFLNNPTLKPISNYIVDIKYADWPDLYPVKNKCNMNKKDN